ncbi:hypothetical protein SAMN05216533_1026 [Streptomyces sp. Ag109_O5-10]|nr:hypothetical protein SAMN05216533_1026 [Streptomyces sp. Ag109_O5-10]
MLAGLRDHEQPADEKPVRPLVGAGIASDPPRAFEFADAKATTCWSQGPRAASTAGVCHHYALASSARWRRTQGVRCHRRNCSTPARKHPPTASAGACRRTPLSQALSHVCHQLRRLPRTAMPDLRLRTRPGLTWTPEDGLYNLCHVVPHTKPRDRKDPDHRRTNRAATATSYTITAVQGLASAIPPADQESSGVVLAEEAGLLLEARKRAPELGNSPSGALLHNCSISKAKRYFAPDFPAGTPAPRIWSGPGTSRSGGRRPGCLRRSAPEDVAPDS